MFYGYENFGDLFVNVDGPFVFHIKAQGSTEAQRSGGELETLSEFDTEANFNGGAADYNALSIAEQNHVTNKYSNPSAIDAIRKIFKNAKAFDLLCAQNFHVKTDFESLATTAPQPPITHVKPDTTSEPRATYARARDSALTRSGPILRGPQTTASRLFDREGRARTAGAAPAPAATPTSTTGGGSDPYDAFDDLFT